MCVLNYADPNNELSTHAQARFEYIALIPSLLDSLFTWLHTA